MSSSPLCPRCGYDLSGVAASWRDACPLEGTCSECGLGIRWAELLNPLLTVPRWSFEHAYRCRSLALVLTTMRALQPRRLWRGLRMEHPVRLGRLAVAAGCGAVLVWAVAAALTFTLIAGLNGLMTGVFPSEGAIRGAFYLVSHPFEPSRYSSAGRPWSGRVDPWIIAAVAWWVLLPLGFLVIPVTLRRARIRPRHFARIWTYSMANLPLALAAWLIPEIADQILWAAYRAYFNPSNPNPRLWNVFLGYNAWVDRHQWVIFAGIVGVWGITYWASATRLYLRLPHATPIAVWSGTFAAGIVLLAALLIPGGTVALFYIL